MPFTPVDILNSPDHWTQHLLARDAADKGCYAISPQACKFCLSGALERWLLSFRPIGNLPIGFELYVRQKVWNAIAIYRGHPLDIEVFNDHKDTTFADVQAVLRIADELKAFITPDEFTARHVAA